MRLSDLAFDQGDLVVALTEARRAASAYAPGLEAVGRAHERMVAIATGSEETGNRELAVRAWRSVRAAALDVRHLWSPFEAERRLAEERLERLERNAGTQEGEARQAGVRATSPAAARAGDIAHALGTVASLVATTLGLAMAAWRGFSKVGDWCWTDGKWGLLLAGLGLGCWSVLVVWT